jgi:hypothetical protein
LNTKQISSGQEAQPITAVWQNGGFSAKFNGSSSIELLCKTEHFCFDFRHFAKLQTVSTNFKKMTTMSKKSLDRKVAQRTIIDCRANGKTDQEIYNELSQQYYDKKTVALLITGTVKDESRAKYKIYNNILLGLIGLTILFKVLAVFSLSLSEGQLWALLLIFIVPILNIYFFYEISRYNAPIYRFCGLLTIASFFQAVGKAENVIDIFISLALCAGISGLSFYLDSKMFPDYSPKNLKKDNKGEYILG